MKKRVVWLLCCVGLISGLCLTCEIPKSITIKGKPGVYLPLGNPLNRFDDDERLENYISDAKIREMMGNSGADNKIALYEYQGEGVDSNVQAYIVHYPIAEMKLDLEEYVKEASQDDGDRTLSYTLPALITDTPDHLFPAGGYYLTRNSMPQEEETGPLFTISLADMAKLVKEVNGGPFGLEINYTSSFQNNIWIKIPAFGIADYKQGTPENGKLRFADTPADGKFIPKQAPDGKLNSNDEIEIFVKVTGSCSGTIEPEMVFEWNTATVYTITNESLKGEYQLKNELGEFLGKGVNFKKADGYIYVNNVGNETKLTLTENENPLVSNQILIGSSKPVFTDIVTSLPPQSLADPIPLVHVLNSDSKLEYQIKIPEIGVTKEDKSKTITIDLVILLPLEFKVSAEPSVSSFKDRYVKLELDNLFPEAGDDDLFLRESKDDSLLSNITSFSILLKNFQNDILGGEISILVSPPDSPFELKDGGKLTLNMKDLPFPFSPKFEIILLKDSKLAGGYEEYATLWIKRQMHPGVERKFDFSLAVEARADLNYTIDL